MNLIANLRDQRSRLISDLIWRYKQNHEVDKDQLISVLVEQYRDDRTVISELHEELDKVEKEKDEAVERIEAIEGERYTEVDN